MSNKKAQAFIRELSRVLANIKKSGVVFETVSMKEHYQLFKLSSEINDIFHVMDEVDPVIRVDRLTVLVDYLERGKFTQKFNLGNCTYSVDYPTLFPNEWRKGEDEKFMYGIEYIDIECDFFEGERFFYGLTDLQHRHLFFEYNQNPEWGNVKINCRSGIKTLIKNISRFCEYINRQNSREANHE